MANYQLAQCNIARLRAPIDSPLLSEFVAALEPINRLADEAPGFVWRLQTETGDATAIRVFDDEMLMINMSVWESIDTLLAFTYGTAHRDVMRRRRQWFERLASVYLVLWWIPKGTLPTPSDARTRLEMLEGAGSSPEAFTFRSPFRAPDGADGVAPQQGESPTRLSAPGVRYEAPDVNPGEVGEPAGGPAPV